MLLVWGVLDGWWGVWKGGPCACCPVPEPCNNTPAHHQPHACNPPPLSPQGSEVGAPQCHVDGGVQGPQQAALPAHRHQGGDGRSCGVGVGWGWAFCEFRGLLCFGCLHVIASISTNTPCLPSPPPHTTHHHSPPPNHLSPPHPPHTHTTTGLPLPPPRPRHHPHLQRGGLQSGHPILVQQPGEGD